MFSRFRISIALAVLLTLVFTLPVFAGGWAVITLDAFPTGIVAGEPFTVGFTVLQHGKTPMTGLDATITANLHNKTEFMVDAEPEGKPGHYTATMTFPMEGEWQWSIQAFTMDQSMPVLSVAAPAVASESWSVVKTDPVAAAIPWMTFIRILAIAGGLVGVVLILRHRTGLGAALTVVCLLAMIGSFMTGSAVPAVEAQNESSSEAVSELSISQVEMGRQLFIAKGCITCHRNSKIENSSGYWTIDMGATDLSNFSASPEILFIRLKDPAAAKSDTKMPNLGLKKEEIEALIAFINSK